MEPKQGKFDTRLTTPIICSRGISYFTVEPVEVEVEAVRVLLLLDLDKLSTCTCTNLPFVNLTFLTFIIIINILLLVV